MESSNYSPPHIDASRPSLGFPLGTALLLIVIFSLTGIFSCCYHLDKLRSLRRRQSFLFDGQHSHSDIESPSPSKPKPSHTKDEKESLPVIMPGDKIAKFVALPCPCEPPRADFKVFPMRVEKPLKPPPIVVPLY